MTESIDIEWLFLALALIWLILAAVAAPDDLAALMESRSADGHRSEEDHPIEPFSFHLGVIGIAIFVGWSFFLLVALLVALLFRMPDPDNRSGALVRFGYKKLLFEPIVGWCVRPGPGNRVQLPYCRLRE